MFEELMPWLIYAIIGIAIFIVIAIFSPRYTVVPAHQAHIVVRRKGRTVYCSRENYNSGYWFIHILQKRTILPLENVKMNIENIPLRDKDMAKFLGDVRCWVSIEDPHLASEKLGDVDAEQTHKGFLSIEHDIQDLVQAVTRNSSMKMDVFQIMKEREKFSDEVQKEVAPVLKSKWGIEIADLEVIHFTDAPPDAEGKSYDIIKNLEKRQAKVIEASTRKQIATQEQQAAVSEAIADKEARTKQAENEQEARTKEIEKDQAVGKAEQDKEKAIAEAEEAANEQKIEAKRTLEVGNAEVAKEAAIENATGESESTKLKGFAQAEVDKQLLFAEAAGVDKKAEALKKYTNAGLSLEVIKANVEIKKANFDALARGLEHAKISLVTSGESNILGLNVSAETGADLGQMIMALAQQGVDVTDLLDKLPITETAKMAIAANLGMDVVKEAHKELPEPTQQSEPESSKAKEKET